MSSKTSGIGGENLTISEMLEIAQLRGLQVPRRTLVGACARGKIVGAYRQSISGRAKRDSGTWFAPRKAYFTWLRMYTPHCDGVAQQASRAQRREPFGREASDDD